MSARRSNTGFGPNPISDEGVLAWQRRRGITLLRIEHEILDEIEEQFFRSQPQPKVK